MGVVVKRRTDERLSHAYRPGQFTELAPTVNKAALLRLLSSDSHSRVLLLHGPLGTGKTTVARLIARAVNCDDHREIEPCEACVACKASLPSLGVQEMNVADTRGIDDIRELRALLESGQMSFGPGRKRVYILDEAQQLTREAQNVLLKPLESPPKDVYVILCTTEPNKLIPTLRSRCTGIRFSALSESSTAEYLKAVITAEGRDPTTEEMERYTGAISRVAESPREALNMLEMAFAGGSVDTIQEESASPVIPHLCKMVIGDREGGWRGIRRELQLLKGNNPEGTRIQMANYLRGWLMRGQFKEVRSADAVDRALGHLTETIMAPDAMNILVHMVYQAWRSATDERKR